MTSHSSARPPAPPPRRYADRAYRSGAGMAGGVALLVLAGWLGGDAVLRGEGRVPWLALAGLLAVVPLVVAFTLRPAVFAGDERLRVRNPFRTVTLPWASVEGVRAGYSSEVVAEGVTYQMWALPVSLRARKRATRQAERAAAKIASGREAAAAQGRAEEARVKRAPSDQAVEELRRLAEQHGEDEHARGRPRVRWAYEILVPSVLGAVLLAVLIATG